jgi:hypothetical protein
MDLVIFTGRIPRAELEEERAGEFARMQAERRLDAIAAPPPSADLRRISRIIGTTAVTVGLTIVALIVYAVLTRP